MAEKIETRFSLKNRDSRWKKGFTTQGKNLLPFPNGASPLEEVGLQKKKSPLPLESSLLTVTGIGLEEVGYLRVQWCAQSRNKSTSQSISWAAHDFLGVSERTKRSRVRLSNFIVLFPLASLKQLVWISLIGNLFPNAQLLPSTCDHHGPWISFSSSKIRPSPSRKLSFIIFCQSLFNWITAVAYIFNIFY